MKYLFLISLLVIMGCQQPQQGALPEGRRGAAPTPVSQLTPEQKMIQELNERNDRIRSFTARHNFTTRQRRISIGSEGTTYYQDGNIRIMSYALVRNEQLNDIGSVGDSYWFYARRVNQTYMFIGSHSEIMETNLRESLNPAWMLEIIGLSPINLNADIQQDGDNIVVVEERTSTRNQTVYKLTEIDPSKPAIIGHYLITPRQQLLVSARISSFHHLHGAYLPATMEISMPSEQVTITWRIQKPTGVNQPIESSIWQRPSLRVKELDLSSGVRIPDVND